MSLQEMIDPELLLELEPEELAGYVLEDLKRLPKQQQLKISLHDYCLPDRFESYASNLRDECVRAVMEAWMVLEREGLVAHVPITASSQYFLTRRGARVADREGLERLLRVPALPSDTLHPSLRNRVLPQYRRGSYEEAVFAAFKAIEVEVQEACPDLDRTLYGVNLMRRAFRPGDGPMTDQDEQKAEQEALLALFAGAVGRFKNPSSHRHVAFDDATEAVELILFANHLLRIIIDRRSRGE